VNQWFNVNAGFNRNAAQQLQFNLRTFPLLSAGMRGDGRATWAFSAIKNLTILEAIDLQFRAECYNSFNDPNFSGPNTYPTGSAFGTITSAASDPRNGQFSLKVKF